MVFKKATRKRGWARIALIGPSGSGKSFTAQRLAQGLGKRVAVIDTERGSASLYSDEFDFSVMELTSFHPQKYVEAIREAEASGFDVVIIDSLSHGWMGKDGALELIDQTKKKKQSNDGFGAWRDVTPIHNKLVDTMLDAKLHVIATMRSKQEYVVEEYEEQGRKKTRVRKLGLQPVQRQDLEFEFDIVGDMDQDNNFIVTKSRMKTMAGRTIHQPDASVGEEILMWLGGASPDEPTLEDRRETAKDQLRAFAALIGPAKCLELCGKSSKDMETVEELEAAVAKLREAHAAGVKLSVVPPTDTAKTPGPAAKPSTGASASKPADGTQDVSRSVAAPAPESKLSPAEAPAGAAAPPDEPSHDDLPLDDRGARAISASDLWRIASQCRIERADVLKQIKNKFARGGAVELTDLQRGEIANWIEGAALVHEARRGGVDR